MGYFANKVVWITGASSGIGEALVIHVIGQGATVIASFRDREKLEKVKQRCGAAADRCHTLVVDLEKPGNFRELVGQVYDKFGRIDLMLHVGGVSQRSLAAETSMEVTRRIMEINFFGTVALNQAILPYMIRQGGGQIAVTSSIVGKFGFPMRSAYSASKHALHGYFESLRSETAGKNIQISLLVIGRINTDISVNALTADGTTWGKLDPGQATGLSPEECARKILRGLKRGKREILVGGREMIMVYLKAYLPFLFWKLARRVSAT